MAKTLQIKTVRELQNLKDMKGIYALTGNYKGFRNASREFAKASVDNFETVKNLPSNVKGTASLFSKTGLKIAKIWLLNSVAKKTPEERLFAKKIKLETLMKRTAKKYSDFSSTPVPINETIMKKYEKWKQATILIEKTKTQIAQLEQRLEQ